MENNDEKDPNAVEETPHIPIKTYQWEDVKRARKKGGYPWTHLTKPPYDEEIDAESFTMDAYRRSRSSSTLGKCSLQDISEGEHVDDISNQEKDADTPSLHAINRQSIVKSEESYISPSEPRIAIHVQSDHLPENNENLLNVSNSSICASSEGTTKKRKLSIESSHSRISMSKLAIKDKLKSAKEKLKLPKLIKRSKSDVQVIKKPKVQKKDNTGFSSYQGKSEPVYIHIPLKLPPGETDEYSKYEFESRPTSRSASLTHLTHFGSGKRKLSLLGLLTELKRLYDDQVMASESKQEPSSNKTDSNETLDTGTSNSKSIPDKINIDDIIDQRKHNLKRSSRKSTQELKEMLAASPDTNEISQYLDEDDKYDILTTEIPNLDIDCVIITDYDQPSEDKENHSNVHDGWSDSTVDKNYPTRVRAKSEEPKRKRKSSIDSSYSRKSLSKLAFMKKIKNVKDSITLPKFLSFNKLDTNSNKSVKDTEITTSLTPKSETRVIKKQSEQPLYIHIPLKLPDGQQDEFSHLAGNDKQSATHATKQDEIIPECETPITPVVPGSDVQLIFVTPPSDDEILDSNIPETPSESNQKFFETIKVDELKTIAKNAVDFIYPDKKKLDVVTEDEKIETGDLNGIATEGETTYWQMHPVLVDEEDGLKLSDAAIAMINEEMAKEIKIEKEHKPSPQLKKKVSFKRARAQDGERIYEDVGLSVEPSVQDETFRSMSTEEEKSYLDEKVIKTTSLDEDYNKWSQITDHEYEPVIPPPDEDTKLTTLTNDDIMVSFEQPKHITFNEQLTSDTITDIHTETPAAQELQDQIEDRFFKTSPVALPKISRTSKPLPTFDAPQPGKTDAKKKESSTNQHSRGNKFNNAIKMQAEKIKSKLQGLKRPHINLPQSPKLSTATFSKLKFKKPKMPELPSIKLASLKRNDSKNLWRKRQLSTESNAGDSKTKKFSFKTYPRIFAKSKVLKQSSFCDSIDKTTPAPGFATVPRVKATQKELVRETSAKVEDDEEPKEYYYDKDRGFVTIPIDQDNNHTLHLQSSVRYDQDINDDDGYNDSGDDAASPKGIKGGLGKWKNETNKMNLISNTNRDGRELQSDQSSASLSDHRQGVLEEIDSDQFFLREKGISQDDIDVGQYLSSEIKEAFRNPRNALTHFQSEEREYDVDITDQSQSSEEIPKRKWIKKPKRKKTPHVSNEQLSFEFGSDPEDYATKHKVEYIVQVPTRPKRRSKKSKKNTSEINNIVPYRETMPLAEPLTEQLDFIDNSNLFPDEVVECVEHSHAYKNENGAINHFYINTQDEEIEVSPPMYINACQDIDSEIISKAQPIRPLRKNKIRNINAIEVDPCADKNDSIERSINGFEECARIEDAGYQNTPPCRPDRKRSRTRSESENSFLERIPLDPEEPPVKPVRLHSSTRSKSTPSIQDNQTKTPPPVRPIRFRSRTRSESTESLPSSQDLSLLLEASAPEIICIEETCIQIVCDPMGYAVVDKSKIRDPPLPPSRFPQTPPRTRRKKTQGTGKFATVPRPPSRPLRNYSTLNKPTSTSKGSVLEDDKENIDINPYIEIDEDELARRLQSGEVIQKMRERPLPAPPRPPRKAKTPTREVLRDISHERNLPKSNSGTLDSKHSEPLQSLNLFEIEQQILTDDHEETITHAALVVQPIGQSSVLSYSETFNESLANMREPERIVLIEQDSDTLEYQEPCDSLVRELAIQEFSQTNDDKFSYQPTADSDDEECSEIPAEFHELNSPQVEAHETLDNYNIPDDDVHEIDTIDSEVDELVNAKPIMCLQSIDTHTRIPEHIPKTDALMVDEELPENTILEILERLQMPYSSSQHLHDDEEELEDDLPELIDETQLPPVPPRSDSVGNLVDVIEQDEAPLNQNFNTNFTDTFETPPSSNKREVQDESANEIPIRPPRRCSQTEKQTNDFNLTTVVKTEENKCPVESVIPVVNINREHDVSIEQSFDDSVEDSTNLTQENYLRGEHETSDTSHPPPSFYNLQSPITSNFDGTAIPLHRCSTCHHRFKSLSRSSSSEELYQRQRRPRRLSEPSIPELTGQLVQSCSAELDRSLRNLMSLLSDNFLSTTERKEDLKVILLMLVILIASLILMNGDKVAHHHHWDYFNPPKEF